MSPLVFGLIVAVWAWGGLCLLVLALCVAAHKGDSLNDETRRREQ